MRRMLLSTGSSRLRRLGPSSNSSTLRLAVDASLEALTYHEVAEVLSDVLGRDISYERPSLWRSVHFGKGCGTT